MGAVEFLRARDAATLVGLSEKTLANLRSAGLGPAYEKRGRLVFYPVAALVAWSRSTVTEVHAPRHLRAVGGAA